MAPERRKPNTEIVALQHEVDSLRALIHSMSLKLEALENSIKEFMTMYQGAKWSAGIIRWGAAVMACVVGAYAAIKGLK